MTADLGRLLAGVGAVLLDFDGPVCSIFAGYPASQVAAELIDVLQRHGVNLPPGLATRLRCYVGPGQPATRLSRGW